MDHRTIHWSLGYLWNICRCHCGWGRNPATRRTSSPACLSVLHPQSQQGSLLWERHVWVISLRSDLDLCSVVEVLLKQCVLFVFVIYLWLVSLYAIQTHMYWRPALTRDTGFQSNSLSKDLFGAPQHRNTSMCECFQHITRGGLQYEYC